jgi:DNA replication and repair protein RecF
MKIENIILRNFRNYGDENISFHPKINIIYGENAQGKTNILEAIYYLARFSSFKSACPSECLKFGEENGMIEGRVIHNGLTDTLKISFLEGKKQGRINEKKTQKKHDFQEKLSLVMFVPDDLGIVKSSPVNRRRFINREITNIRPHYDYLVRKYNRILLQRNQLLKQIRSRQESEATLELWDQPLVEYGCKIIYYRLKYLMDLNKRAEIVHYNISNGAEKLSLSYKSNIVSKGMTPEDIRKSYEKTMKERHREDILKGSTSSGPHVDDFVIRINDRDARIYASQGQQRSIVLSLKIALIEMNKEEKGHYPVILLDDVMSELDQNRREKLFPVLHKTQSFITGTDAELAEKLEEKEYRLYKVSKGKILNRELDTGGNE